MQPRGVAFDARVDAADAASAARRDELARVATVRLGLRGRLVGAWRERCARRRLQRRHLDVRRQVEVRRRARALGQALGDDAARRSERHRDPSPDRCGDSRAVRAATSRRRPTMRPRGPTRRLRRASTPCSRAAARERCRAHAVVGSVLRRRRRDGAASRASPPRRGRGSPAGIGRSRRSPARARLAAASIHATAVPTAIGSPVIAARSRMRPRPAPRLPSPTCWSPSRTGCRPRSTRVAFGHLPCRR